MFVLTIGESRADGQSPAAILRKRYPEVMPLAEIQSARARTGHRYASSSGRRWRMKGLMSIGDVSQMDYNERT